jgi:hypothetical protein
VFHFYSKKSKFFKKKQGAEKNKPALLFFFFSLKKMDDYTREMMDLKTLVTRTLEKKGVLAKIRVSNLQFPFYNDNKLKVQWLF